MFNPAAIPPTLSVIIGLGLAMLSVIRGRFRLQNILFALVILWWSLISAAFVLHQICAGDTQTILEIERIIHVVYVFVPVINLLFFHSLLGIKRTWLVAVFFAASIALSLQVPGDSYFTGIHVYSWGSIAAGGSASHLVGIYGLIFICYLLLLLVSRLKREDNRLKQLKIRYMLLSIIVIAVMQIMNLPAMYGVDIYPVGSFIFIPLAILAYGILQHRLLDIRTVLHLTLLWALVTSLSLVLNIAIYTGVRDILVKGSGLESSTILIGWFVINYLYFSRIQPKIDFLFNRRKFDLKKAGIETTGNMLRLRTVDELGRVLAESMQTVLFFRRAALYVRHPASGILSSRNEADVVCPQALAKTIAQETILQMDLVLTDPGFAESRADLVLLFARLDCEYIVPVARDTALVALLVLKDRKNLKQLNPDEKNFINTILSAVQISLANARLYQDLSNLKDNLEVMVNARTAELNAAMAKMEAANTEIRETRNQLQNERDRLAGKNRLMEEELVLARKIQEQFIPEKSPSRAIHAIYQPMHQVGGDFYDFLKFRNPDKIGIFVSDVSGHGVPAAFITSMIKTLILQTGKTREDPAGLLAWLNPNLVHHCGGNFVTALYGIFDRSSREFLFANAGHNDPYLVTDKGCQPLVGTRSLPLGVMDNEPLVRLGKLSRNTLLTLPENSRLVLYTDGLTECTHRDNPNHMFEEVLVGNGFFNDPDSSVKSFAERIHAEMVSFREDDSFDDDVCIICMDTG